MKMKLDIGNVLKSMIGYFWSTDKNWEEDQKPIKYVVAKSGLYEIRETEILKAVAKPQEVKGMQQDLKEGISMKTPKIPYILYLKMLKFLRDVYTRDSSEATIHVFWNREDKNYFLWVPKQTNGAASSNYDRDNDKEFVDLCNKHAWVLTAHSHPGFGGKFSSIDDRDEKDTRLFMVVGYVMKDQQDVAIRTAVNGKHVALNFYDVFENPTDSLQDTPQEWLDKCKKAALATKRTSGTYHGYGQGNYYSNYEGNLDDLYADADSEHLVNQYGIPIGMDDSPEVDILEDIDDYCGEDPLMVSAAIRTQEKQERESMLRQEHIKSLAQKSKRQTSRRHKK